MARKEDVDFYCSFSRKELQSLCKKYNLPANRSRSDMAESLASYFERNSLSSVVFGVGGIRDSSAAASGAPSGTGDVKKDSDGSKLEIIREDCSQTVMARKTGCTLGDKTHYQELHGGSIESARAPQFIRRLNEKDPTANPGKDFHQATHSPLENGKREVNSGEPQETPSPGCSTYSSLSSFEFHVSSEEGINLSVDLNFNPSDWINSMRNEVYVCNSMRTKKFRSSDHGTNYPTESKKQKTQSPLNVNLGGGKDGHAVMKGNSQTPSDHQSNGEGSLTSSVIEPCSRRRDASDNYKKDKGHNFSIPDSAPGQIVSCAESCSKNCCVVSLDSDCVYSTGKRLARDSVTVAAECPITLDAQDNLTGELPNEIPENPFPGSPRKVGNSSTVTPICPGGGGSRISSSEAKPYQPNPSCSPCTTSRSLNLSESKLIKDAESKGYSKLIFQYNAGKNWLASNVVEQEKSGTISGQERSELLV